MKPSSSSLGASSSSIFTVSSLGISSPMGEHFDYILCFCNNRENLTKIAQDVLELGQHDGAVLVLVVQFAQLNVVVVIAGAVGLLDGLLHEFDDLVILAELLAGVVGLAVLDGDLFDDVHAQSIEDVHEVVHVNLAFGIPIVDGADFLDFISVDRHLGLI